MDPVSGLLGVAVGVALGWTLKRPAAGPEAPVLSVGAAEPVALAAPRARTRQREYVCHDGTRYRVRPGEPLYDTPPPGVRYTANTEVDA